MIAFESVVGRTDYNTSGLFRIDWRQVSFSGSHIRRVVHKNAGRGRGGRPLHLAAAHSSRTPFYATLQVYQPSRADPQPEINRQLKVTTERLHLSRSRSKILFSFLISLFWILFGVSESLNRLFQSVQILTWRWFVGFMMCLGALDILRLELAGTLELVYCLIEQ